MSAQRGTKWRKAAEKLSLVQAIDAMVERGCVMEIACKALGISRTLYWRYRKQTASGGLTTLAPKKPTGRPPVCALAGEAADALRGLTLTYDSVNYAIEEFADSERCPSEVRALIRRIQAKAAEEGKPPNWPRSLRRAAYVTADEQARFRGKRKAQAREFSPPKGMFFQFEDTGPQIPIITHTCWQMDDYSTNQPYIVQGSDGSPRLARQYLTCMDLYSQAWLGVEAIGRERDAYRGEDILRFILRTIDGQGTMPHYLTLERGRWDSKAVHGLPLTNDPQGPKWGGLDQLFCIRHVYTPRGKGELEGGLNFLQRILAHSGLDIGRVRGEFANATKAMLAVNEGRLDPLKAGFLTQQASAELHLLACQKFNKRPKQRQPLDSFVSPNDLLETAEKPNPLPEDERWRFHPVKSFATVMGGHVKITPPNWPLEFWFTVNGIKDGIYLEDGYRVLIAFDPAEPNRGAVIGNRETGSKNRKCWALGENFLVAQHARAVPQWIDQPGGYKDSVKRKANAAADMNFRSIRRFAKGMTVDVKLGGDGTTTIHQTGVAPATRVAPAGLSPDGGQDPASTVPARGSAPACPRKKPAWVPIGQRSRAEMIKHSEEKAAAEEAIH